MIKAVLFDLDGTLADTALDLGAALNRMLAARGLPPQPYSAIRPLASHGARGLVGLGFGREHPEFEALRLSFLDEYEHGYADETRLFDGIAELIVALAQRGRPWGIVTNKPSRFTDRLVPALPFPLPPAVVVSGDTVGVAKPDPRPMHHAARTLSLAATDCLYVGDAARDIEAGRAAGMRTALVNWGYFDASDHAENWGADLRVDHPLQLLDHLD
jgi:phosphoglycolate phosphatase